MPQSSGTVFCSLAEGANVKQDLGRAEAEHGVAQAKGKRDSSKGSPAGCCEVGRREDGLTGGG